MRNVYQAEIMTDAALIRDMLAEAGIRAQLVAKATPASSTSVGAAASSANGSLQAGWRGRQTVGVRPAAELNSRPRHACQGVSRRLL